MDDQPLPIDNDLRNQLVNYFCKLGFDLTTAEDLTHDTWIRVHEKRLSIYALFGTALNLALEKWKKNKKEENLISNLKKNSKEINCSDDSQNILEQKEEQIEQQKKLERCYTFLECLTDKEKSVYIKKKLNELSYEEIAKELDISSVNARQIFHRAVIKLVGEIDDADRM